VLRVIALDPFGKMLLWMGEFKNVGEGERELKKNGEGDKFSGSWGKKVTA